MGETQKKYQLFEKVEAETIFVDSFDTKGEAEKVIKATAGQKRVFVVVWERENA